MTDEEIINLAKGGQPEAFRALYDRTRESVYGLAFRYVRSPQDAEDIMQETFIKAFKGIRRFDIRAGSSFTAWLGTICVHCAIEHLRRTRRRGGDVPMSLSDLPQEPASGDPSPERAAFARRSLSDVEEAYRRLSLPPGADRVNFYLSPREENYNRRPAVEAPRFADGEGIDAPVVDLRGVEDGPAAAVYKPGG